MQLAGETPLVFVQFIVLAVDSVGELAHLHGEQLFNLQICRGGALRCSVWQFFTAFKILCLNIFLQGFHLVRIFFEHFRNVFEHGFKFFRKVFFKLIFVFFVILQKLGVSKLVPFALEFHSLVELLEGIFVLRFLHFHLDFKPLHLK